jgi:hypothetical protein
VVLCGRDEISGTLSDDQARHGPTRNRQRNVIYISVKRESSAGWARRFVVPAMQVDAAPLGVRHDAGLVARQRERRAR